VGRQRSHAAHEWEAYSVQGVIHVRAISASIWLFGGVSLVPLRLLLFAVTIAVIVGDRAAAIAGDSAADLPPFDGGDGMVAVLRSNLNRALALPSNTFRSVIDVFSPPTHCALHCRVQLSYLCVAVRDLGNPALVPATRASRWSNSIAESRSYQERFRPRLAGELARHTDYSRALPGDGPLVALLQNLYPTGALIGPPGHPADTSPLDRPALGLMLVWPLDRLPFHFAWAVGKVRWNFCDVIVTAAERNAGRSFGTSALFPPWVGLASTHDRNRVGCSSGVPAKLGCCRRYARALALPSRSRWWLVLGACLRTRARTVPDARRINFVAVDHGDARSSRRQTAGTAGRHRHEPLFLTLPAVRLPRSFGPAASVASTSILVTR